MIRNNDTNFFLVDNKSKVLGVCKWPNVQPPGYKLGVGEGSR